MLKSFKFLMLGIGIGLIAASFFVPVSGEIGQNPRPNYSGSNSGVERNRSVYDAGATGEKEALIGQVESNRSVCDTLALHKEVDQKEKENGGKKQIVIPAGTDSYTVAKILYENRLIKSPEEFDNRIVEMGLDTRIRAGKYSISPEMTIDKIIFIITGRDVQNR